MFIVMKFTDTVFKGSECMLLAWWKQSTRNILRKAATCLFWYMRLLKCYTCCNQTMFLMETGTEMISYVNKNNVHVVGPCVSTWIDLDTL